MKVIASICNLALLLVWLALFAEHGIPRQNADMLLAVLMLAVPVSSLWALWRVEGREIPSWLVLELKARKAVLGRRLQHGDEK